MASPEWVREHRELQYLRAAAAARPPRRLSRKEHGGRRAYAAERWSKYLAVKGLGDGRN